MFRNLIRTLADSAGLEIRRTPTPVYSEALISLPGPEQARGRVLIAYILQPFLDTARARDPSHTHFAESVLMAQAWTRLGYQVDVIDYRHKDFIPGSNYDYFVSARRHLADLAPRLNDDCRKIAHLDVSHFTTNNLAAYDRMAAFQRRHHCSVPESLRLMEHNLAIEHADCALMLGNQTTAASYSYAGKDIQKLNVPSVADYEWIPDRNFERIRRSFLWMGSSGLLHKGLDLTFEAFAEMSDLQLIVCGPLEREARFMSCYSELLANSPNIVLEGWTDVTSRRFKELAAQSIGVVYPSCAEGQAGSVVTCLRAGLVPIVSPQTGLDTGEHGTLIADASVDAIMEAVRTVADTDPTHLEARARLAWETGEQDHSQKAYSAKYQSILEANILR